MDDRLYKIRHCMNIEGLVRELPLFEPPIDPALLVRAAAAGVDLGAAIADIAAPLPCVRFSLLLAKALELAGELRSLGAGLLAALEKRDAEALANLRAGQDTDLLRAVRGARARQVDEARAALAGLEAARKVTEERHRFYRDIKDRSSFEAEQIARLSEAQDYQSSANELEIGVALAAQIPNMTTGLHGATPVTTATWGGSNVVAGLQGASRFNAWKGSEESYKATMASIKGGWARRSEEWKFQERLAARELAQIDQQIAAARIRVEIAELELAAHERQIENAIAVEEHLRDKYTNEELYGWMVSQTSAVYFQAYRLAYDLARRAERAYRHERGLTSSDFIRPGHWEDLRRGLLAGERLSLDLRRLESAYLEQNRREHELSRHVSLAEVDPFALLALREVGTCEVTLPEWLFDLDHPGHYFRRLKTVSLTASGVTGPHAGINGRLTLTKSTYRCKSTLLDDSYARSADAADERFVDDFVAQSIVTSSGQADAGLFEVSLRDERLLPFEGAGAESRWEVKIPPEHNAFDAEGLNDVVLHLRYTARDGGQALGEKAAAALCEAPDAGQAGPLVRYRLIS
ncbi:MAG: hypothetical protein IT372_16915, partial [Polyangiaceae bacterium]|nr:hypothetical protein [Polyangiaceae bacterium]